MSINKPVPGQRASISISTDTENTYTVEPLRKDIEFLNLVVTPGIQEWNLTLIDDDTYRITNRAVGDTLTLDIINDGVFDQLKLAPSETRSSQK